MEQDRKASGRPQTARLTCVAIQHRVKHFMILARQASPVSSIIEVAPVDDQDATWAIGSPWPRGSKWTPIGGLTEGTETSICRGKSRYRQSPDCSSHWGKSDCRY